MLNRKHNSHIFICGQTRSGKTFFAANELAQLPDPVLFFNIQEEQLPKSFIKVSAAKTSYKQVIEALRAGCKVDIRFPLDEGKTEKIEAFLFKQLLFAGFSEKKPLYIAVDECHLLRGSALDYAIQAATRGLKRGIRCVFITQRPALCSKTLYTQATDQYIFYLAPSEAAYMKQKGLDYAEMLKTWKKYGKYSHVYFDGFKIEGRRAI